MEQFLTRKNLLIGFAIAMIIIAALFAYGWFGQKGYLPPAPPPVTVVEEKMVTPDTTVVPPDAGRVVEPGIITAPINPDQGKVVSANAILTLKGGYGKALDAALAWAPDAALIFIKSLGVVTAEGKSGEWQVTFGSKEKRAGFEVLVFGDAVASTKEIPSTSFGEPLPQNWYDSGDALISLRTLPQFETATVSSINFYYNADGKKWGYALATSNGSVSMPVK